ncbi:MAG: PAS domain S-box protein, partial [Chloroflexota bacterium]
MRALLWRFDVRVSLGYFIVAILWIALSDSLVGLIFTGKPAMVETASVLKGMTFVLVTALGLFAVLRRELQKRDLLQSVLENDISEHKRTLEALRQSESRFATIFHASPVPTGISHLKDGLIVDVNDALVKMTGCEREELIGHTATELGLWVFPEKRAAGAQSIADGSGVLNIELPARTKSGALIQVLASVQLIDLGDVPHLVSMFYDITEQKKLEAQLRYQALLLDNVSDAIISTDVDFNIRSWNPAAEAIYGWKAEEVIGKPVQGVVQGEYLDSTEQEALHQLQTEGVWRGEMSQPRKEGSKVYLQASTSFVRDSAGSVIGVVSVNRDITERMQAHHELQEAEVLRLELEKEKDLLQLKERFISVVSHEFRTPLSVIMSSSELIERFYDRMPRERQLEHLRVILAQAEFMTGLLNDVLTVNKARAGRLEFNPAPLNLVTFAQTTLERIQVLDKGTHNFVLSHEDDLSGVKLDAKLLQHILVNLLSNAVKYSPEGGDVCLEIRRENEHILIRVSDQGIGIPPESLNHLYEPFSRGSNTGQIGGTGLGMTIVKESIDLHKGTIACESAVGVGTIFTV